MGEANVNLDYATTTGDDVIYVTVHSDMGTGAAMPLDDVRHVIIWQYEVRPGQQDRFERIYGPSGDWAKLFSSDPMYYGTFLHQDANHRNRYCTVDLWASASAFAAFKSKHSAAYAALDEQCDNLTLSEKRIGGFDRNDQNGAK